MPEIIIIISLMNSRRDLPREYLQNCPIVDDKYKVLFKLGTGRFSKVRMAICLPTNQNVAIKIINEKETQDSKLKQYDPKVLQSFLDQVKMCAQSKHKNIIKIIDFQVGGVHRSADGSVRRVLYYVMQIMGNGELHRIIKETDMFSERMARLMFRQLISAVSHLHDSRIAHRDIKPENILIDSKLTLKLADFGCSSYFLDNDHNRIAFDPREPIGSLKSNAPQITNAEKQGIYHGDSLDLFACGYVLFEMVMKSPPFKSSDHQDQYYCELIKDENSSFWKIFSGTCDPSVEFKDLIEKLLDPNPKTRLSLHGLKQHPWYLGEIPKKSQLKKQMNTRFKKVGQKVRKEQEEQIRAFFKLERSKMECGKLQEVKISRDCEEQIMRLRELIRLNDSSDSSSSCASFADAKDFIKESQQPTIDSQSTTKRNEIPFNSL